MAGQDQNQPQNQRPFEPDELSTNPTPFSDADALATEQGSSGSGNQPLEIQLDPLATIRESQSPALFSDADATIASAPDDEARLSSTAPPPPRSPSPADDAATLVLAADQQLRSETATEVASQPGNGTDGPSRSTWNLRIHSHNVEGQLSGIVNRTNDAALQASPVAAAIAQSASAPEYQILGMLAQGGMGIVYRARQTSLNREMAIKTLKPGQDDPIAAQEMFVSEAVITANLVHPNIVPVHDLGRNAEGKLFYSMKQVSGRDWRKAMPELSREENLDILLKVCDAVAYAHSQGVINRDLKPENVFVGSYGEVIVLDWGLAVVNDRFSRRDSVLISTRGCAGTLAYAAPELFDTDTRRICPQTDVYLLGAILFEILEGFPPHILKSFSQLAGPRQRRDAVFAAVRNNQIEQDVRNSGELMQIARQAMATVPSERFPSVEELQKAIRQYRTTGRAEELLAEVRSSTEKTTSYDQYQQSVALFTEALRLWPSDQRAIAGDRAARRGFAELALRRSDFDLGLEVVADRSESELQALATQLKAGRRRRTIIRTTWLVSSGLAMLLLGLTLIFQLDLQSARRDLASASDDFKRADAKRKVAEKEAEAAEALVAEAESRKQAADAAAKQAVAGQQAAESARQQAEQDKQTAQKAERDANDARKQAVMLADAANLARKSADEAAATAMLNQRKAVQELTKANEEKQRVIAESEAITKQARADVAAAEAEVRSQQSLADRVALDSLIQQLEAQQDLREWQALIPLATKALQELEERAAAGRPNPWFTDAVRNSIREKLQQATRQANAPASSARLEFPERTTLAALSDDGRTLVRILRQADQPTAPRHLEFLNAAAPNAPDKSAQRLPFNEQSSVDRLLVSKHGAHVAVLLKTGKVLIFSRSQQQQFEQRAEVPLTIGGRPFRTAFLTFSGNEQRLYLAASDRRTSLQILDLTAAQTQPLLQETALFADPAVDHRCTHFAVSPDERFLLHYSAEGRDRFVRAFPMVTGTTTGSLQPDTRPEAVTRMNIGQLRIRQPAGDGAGQFLPETLLTLSLTPDGSALILGLNSRSDRRAWAWLPRNTAANETEFPFAVGRDDALLEAFASADDQLPAFLKVSLDGRRIVAGHLRRRDNLEVWTVQNGRIQPASEFQLHQYQGGGRVSAIVSGQSEAVVDAAFTDGTAGLLTSVDSRAVTHWNLPGYGDFVRERQQLVDEFRRLKTPAAAPPAKGNAGRRLPAAGIATPVSLPFEDSDVSSPSVLQDEFRPKFLQRWTSVYSLQFNPVNGRLLVGADDLAAHLLDSNGKPVLSVSSRPDPLREQLTAGSGTESGGYLTEGHNSNIVATRFLPDGSLLTAENLGVICVWDAQPDADGMGQEKCRLLTGSGGGGFAVSPDGRFVVAGGAELQDRAKPDSGLSARVLVWQSSDFDKSAAPAAFRQLQVEAGSADAAASTVQISSVAVSPAGTLVAAGCRNGQILLWSLQDSTLLDLQRSHREDQITAVCFLNDSTLLTAGYDGTVRSWTIENGRLAAAAILVRGSQILSLEATADGRRFAIIDLQPDAPRRAEPVTAENSEGTSAQQSAVEQTVGARLRISLHNSDGQLQLLLQDRLLAETEGVLPLQTGLSWSSDGERLLLLQSGRLTLFGGPQWQPLQAMQVASEQRIPVRAAIRGGAGQPLQVATVGGREAILWDLQTGRALTQFRSHSSGRLTASLSSDQNVVLTVSDALRAFDVREGSGTRGRTLLRVASTDLHQTPLSDARFSPAHGDLRFLSCDQAGELGLWQYRDGVLPQLLQRIPAGEQSVPTWAADSGIVNFVSQVAWRPDGQVFAGLQRGVLHCWSIGLQQSTVAGTDPLKAITLPLPAGLDCRFNDLTWSVDGTTLAAGGVAFREADAVLFSAACVWRVTADGARLVAVLQDDPENERIPAAGSGEQPGGITAIALDAAGGRLLTGGVDARINTWLLPPLDAPVDGNAAPDADAGDTRLEQLKIWWGVQLEAPGLPAHDGRIIALCLHPDGHLASADTTGRLTLWPPR